MKYKIQQILKMKTFQADEESEPECSAKLSAILQISNGYDCIFLKQQNHICALQLITFSFL